MRERKINCSFWARTHDTDIVTIYIQKDGRTNCEWWKTCGWWIHNDLCPVKKALNRASKRIRKPKYLKEEQKCQK